MNTGDIEGGIQVNGASGAENVYTVDGVITNSLINGSSRQNTVFEYLQEVQVKTTGISAEYGGALGGVISAVTKSGGNTMHGEGHYYFDGSVLSAAPVKRLILSPVDQITVGYFQDDKQPNYRNEPGASVGGPIVKDRLFYFGSYSPRLIRRTNNYAFAQRHRPGSNQEQPDCDSGVRQIELRRRPDQRVRLGAADADHADRRASGLQRNGHELHFDDQGRNATRNRSGIRSAAEQRDR